MNWTQYVDAYCERVDPGFWGEPLNALTNGLYLLAAIAMWQRSRGVATAQALAIVVGLIALGSFLFHTVATRWAGMADSLAILLFILIYIYALNRHCIGWPGWAAGLAVLGFFPFAAGVTLLLDTIPFFSLSNFYWAIPVLLFGYAGWLWRRRPATARGMAIGGLMLCASITVRSLDTPLCEALPIGTHFMWHVINAVLLAWMIEVYRRDRLAGAAAGG